MRYTKSRHMQKPERRLSRGGRDGSGIYLLFCVYIKQKKEMKTMTARRTMERIAFELIVEECRPLSTVEIRDAICNKTKHGTTCSGLKGILHDNSPKFKRAGATNRERHDGSTYSLQLWTLRDRKAFEAAIVKKVDA